LIAFSTPEWLEAARTALAGKTRDLAGTPAAPILFSAAMMVVGLVCLAAFRAMKRPAVLAA